MKNSNIKCSVHDCINNCSDIDCCALKSIKIGKIKESHSKENTICENYENKKI
jgi:hypothetical protein